MSDRQGRRRSYRKTYRWTHSTREALLVRAHRRCQGCGDPGTDGKGKGLTKAHVIDEALGGSNDESNLLLFCTSCHGRFDAAKRRQRGLDRR